MKFINQESYQNLIGVYKITCLVSNIIYIGSVSTGSSNRDFITRYNEHLTELKRNTHNPKLQNAFNKYGQENFHFEILEIVEDQNNCLKREQHYLDTLLFAQEYINSNYKDKRFQDLGFNISPTAGSTLGCKHSEESRLENRLRNLKFHEDHPEAREAARVRASSYPEVLCYYCGQSVKGNSGLGRHLKTCSLNPNRIVVDCSFCKKSKLSSEIDSHEITCIKNPNRPERKVPKQVCVCNKEIKGLAAFNNHQKSCKVYQISIL
jgi:group I intron endonuclease